ncbi:lytic transglycosylase domain-containing protein [Paramaledivibacter caminithermalis]|uniref:Soluble lytic murein transglycosylase n=1 Tax=Paramaledivibacter caminithermalis (strain DSM 15212 / CIP 107654 / DViRD3) TaxID=1121301 RepID=A0A1M6ME17_PARC5|nr:lytic transglycosylase domain-containing protein [Paramaledivibacter caminithermalis]SHJ81752.1 soluble lytic murein transglycosylase [Paramaledivibacter caminithermalis DSM 15212]
MRVLDLRRYRLLFLFIAICIVFGVIMLACNFVLRILYPLHYENLIKKYSQEYDLDPLFVASIIRAESKFDANAVSPKGAKGLMQIASITGKWASEELNILQYNEHMLFNPNINIKIGCWYLNKLNKEFNNNTENVLASYNAGSGNVTKWLKNNKYSIDGTKLNEIPFAETREYIKRVNRNYNIYKYLYKK